jgi:uncharacterized membrane protein
VAWFALWILVNTVKVPGVAAFDKFPFPLLTMVVSLEAIFLSLFVLASQNRMTRHSDQRSQLDLQIDMLAEREMTAVLVLLKDLARHLDVKVSLTPEPPDLERITDIHKLTAKLEDCRRSSAVGPPLPPNRPSPSGLRAKCKRLWHALPDNRGMSARVSFALAMAV